MMELERRAQQIKEVVRVSAALRADMKPEAICAQVVQTIHTTLGFRAAVVNLIMPGARHFIIAATAGISDAERQRLLNEPPPVDHIISLLKPDFQVSRSYFIGHEHKYLLDGAGGIMLLTPSAFNAPRSPNSWHPEDVFLVPLSSVRDNRLLGVISLDLPEDGKIPTYESVEIIELLANQAATALDTARLFQERDYERQALEYGLSDLLAHLERMRQRDFSAQVQLRSTALNKVAGALNDVSQTLGNVLADVRDAGMVVRQQSSEMRNATTQLVNSAQRQAEQIRSVSDAVEHSSYEMRQIVARAADSSAIAEEAEDISTKGRQAAELAGNGMNAVREITLQASKRIKQLGESSQEIGQIIQMVSQFASQTHLLALNAAIEAANAGEHGAGFAIVAREIRNLAQNSNDAAKLIHARINAIQNETNQVAVTIENATQQVVLLSELVSSSGAALHAIDSVIQRIVNVIGTVHQTADEQAKAATAVSGTMNTIADITGATWESAEQMRASMDRLAELAGILQSKIEGFRLGVQLQPAITAKLPLTRDTAGPAASFPVPPFPPSPAASFPARSFPSAASAPVDPYGRSMPAMPGPTPGSVSVPGGVPGNSDAAMQATVPMPSTLGAQVPPHPATAPNLTAPPVFPVSTMPPAPNSTQHPAPNFEAAESDTVQMSAVMPPSNGAAGNAGNTGNAGNAGAIGSTSGLTPTTQIYPMSSSPLTPLRLSAMEQSPEASAVTSGTPSNGESPAPSAAPDFATSSAEPLAATGEASDEPAAVARAADGAPSAPDASNDTSDDAMLTDDSDAPTATDLAAVTDVSVTSDGADTSDVSSAGDGNDGTDAGDAADARDAGAYTIPEVGGDDPSGS